MVSETAMIISPFVMMRLYALTEYSPCTVVKNRGRVAGSMPRQAR